MTMKINDIFARPIDRDYDGVIKVDQRDDKKIKTELEEYVVTDELQKHFDKFWKNYAKSLDTGTDKMGAWIKGWFGSGKSALLRVLAYLMENPEIEGKRAYDYFDVNGKIKNPETIEAIKKAESVPTDVVLFNIDAKSSKQQGENTILAVFVRVFNEMQGFCGAIPHLANLERKLTEDGRYDEFKKKFSEISSGEVWEEERDDFDFIQDDLVETLVSMNYMSEDAAWNFCEKVNQPFNYSIEDFAKRVKKYIDSKGHNHHIVFFIDEVGQYVAQGQGRMLNLQTVTEELGNYCHGQVWVVVTSQQAIDTITKMKDNFAQDFSKIQGRFDTRISLSSSDADEVIKKRILAKNKAGHDSLAALYAEKSSVLSNLFFFTGEAEHKLYKDANDFADIYPFVPYQFELLPETLRYIRTKGAAGKSISEGERSLLSMFKESAEAHKNNDIGILMPYHDFYEPIEQFLDHSNRIVISNASKNTIINPDHSENNFTINVLKTLFLIRGLSKLAANVENITTLMMDSIDEDRYAVKEKVKKALGVLVSQQFITKNGDIYQFLSYDELNINRQIASQHVETADIYHKAKELIFDGIYKDRKYRYSLLKGRYIFNISEKLNDSTYRMGQDGDIGINIITGNNKDAYDDTIITTKSMSSQEEVIIVLPPETNDTFEELEQFLQITDFYQKNTTALSEGEAIIRTVKMKERDERYNRAENILREGLADAKIYINGSPFQSRSSDVVSRINDSLERLVSLRFNKLSYIDTAFKDDDVLGVLRNPQTSLISGKDSESNENAQDEVLQYITIQTANHAQISRKNIEDHFRKAPFGYIEEDIHWILARLFMRGKIAFHVSGEQVTKQNYKSQEIADFITKRNQSEKLMIDERKSVPGNQKQAVKEILADVFFDSNVGNNEDELMQTLKDKAREELSALESMEDKYQSERYPGKKTVDDGVRLMKSLINARSPAEFFEAA